MTCQLVFVHGRAQEQMDAVALKAEWIAAFRRGLDRAGLTMPIKENDIRFPYYGDTLYGLVEGAEKLTDVIVRGSADPTEREFIRSVLEEVRVQAGVSDDQVQAAAGGEALEKGPLNWKWVLAILRAVDTHVPGASSKSIALATRDVYQYLRNPGVRDAIEKGVFRAITPEVPTVVVGHSLGTVVTYNMLGREGELAKWRVPLYVTLGSPLAVTAIRKSLMPIDHPTCASVWFNAMDPRDVVALYPLDKKHFDVNPAIVNKTDVANDTENRHGISGYLTDPEVARRVHDALVGG